MEDNTEVTHQKDILVQQKLFYQTLYESRGTIFTDEHLKSFFDDNNPYISKLGQDQKLDLEGELTPQETLSALKLMKNGKSPGMDGLTTEFYKFFWKDINPFLVRSFNHGYEKGHLSVTQRQGVITCLPKEGKSKFYIKNWRPISLLNVDYKICSSSIAQRLKKVLHTIISETQVGFMKCRYIGECTRLVCDLIDRCEDEEIPGLLILLDFEKAFDSLEWSFISKSLEFFGFGESIIYWFQTLHKNVESYVQNNGHLSERFVVRRGVRQGGPLSPYLSIIAVELLSAALQFIPKIKGMSINNSEFLISQYADDSTLSVADDENSLNEALNMISLFSICSGRRANFDKTQVVWIGARRGCGLEP